MHKCEWCEHRFRSEEELQDHLEYVNRFPNEWGPLCKERVSMS